MRGQVDFLENRCKLKHYENDLRVQQHSILRLLLAIYRLTKPVCTCTREKYDIKRVRPKQGPDPFSFFGRHRRIRANPPNAVFLFPKNNNTKTKILLNPKESP
jgi:hypothetical protein